MKITVCLRLFQQTNVEDERRAFRPNHTSGCGGSAAAEARQDAAAGKHTNRRRGETVGGASRCEPADAHVNRCRGKPAGPLAESSEEEEDIPDLVPDLECDQGKAVGFSLSGLACLMSILLTK